MTSGVLDRSPSSERAAGTAPAARGGTRGSDPGNELGVADATAVLSEIGYLLVPGSPFDRGPAYLLVALRPQPTRTHFDPERIEYWSASPTLAQPATLEWPVSALTTRYSWGTIRVVDRVGAANEFVSFGGSLSVARDGALNAALFSSDAPILGLGGRGDAGDPLGSTVAGFFACLRAECGAKAEIARRATSAEPMAIYAAYLARTLALYRSQRADITISPRLHTLLRYESCRLSRDFAAAGAAGAVLARELEANLA